VDPALAVASAGEGNRYGHPHPQVVARYQDGGIPLLVTARDGAVLLATDGRELRMASYRMLTPARIPPWADRRWRRERDNLARIFRPQSRWRTVRRESPTPVLAARRPFALK